MLDTKYLTVNFTGEDHNGPLFFFMFFFQAKKNSSVNTITKGWTNMNTYDLILEELNARVECGELTLEEAELINDYAYEQYVIERKKINNS